MTRVSFSGQEISLSYIWQWYQETEKAINHYKIMVINSLTSSVNMPDTFLSMTKDEILEHFAEQQEELEKLVSLDFVASVEASLRIDYLTRVYNKKKDKISRNFRDLYQNKGLEARLSEDILEIWVNSDIACKPAVGDFRGLLRLRHWLAHGRYWTPKLGRNYSPERVFDISKNLFDTLPADFSGAI
ncbi:hypothetical protein [Candidatus Parabeggiatoa sp. HSG14]|uniref:hypothetical protein n=1 Tax=Candidatus Parabeggiatoa sp. HSG14 TaxID=3055593 RepID=UPI0025A6A751|nr:hypothetical protein [Thiotrichales bacterium HSG14]